MKVIGIAFIGIRTERFEQMRRLLGEVMGMELTCDESDTVGFRFEGTSVEVYSSADEFHSFFDSGPVVGFLVEDFDAAHEELSRVGIAFIGNVQHQDGVSWQYFRGPDGNVY
jgi:catechol 2,3-dioxygenase-like lactoylglutathione lyase family enzyme